MHVCHMKIVVVNSGYNDMRPGKAGSIAACIRSAKIYDPGRPGRLLLDIQCVMTQLDSIS
jgi:hypothetical protein